MTKLPSPSILLLSGCHQREMATQGHRSAFGNNKMNGLFIKMWARWKETNKERCSTSRIVAVESHLHGELEGTRRGGCRRNPERTAAEGGAAGTVPRPSAWEPATPLPSHRPQARGWGSGCPAGSLLLLSYFLLVPTVGRTQLTQLIGQLPGTG